MLIRRRFHFNKGSIIVKARGGQLIDDLRRVDLYGGPFVNYNVYAFTLTKRYRWLDMYKEIKIY